MNNQSHLEALRERLGTVSRIVDNEPLAGRTTLGVGGVAEIFVEPSSEADLSQNARVRDPQGIWQRAVP